MLDTVCFRSDPSPRPGPEPAWFGGRLPERLKVSWAWVWCGWQGDAGGLLRQVLRQRAKRTAQPSGTSHTTLPSSGHGRCLSYFLSCSTSPLSCVVCVLSFLCLSFFFCDSCCLSSQLLQYPAGPQLPFSCQLTFLPFLFAPPLFLCTKSVTEQPNPDLRSNPRPRLRLSAGGVAAVMCPRVAQTSAQSATRVARAERRAGGRRRPRKSPSSGAGRRAATTTPTKRNRATAMSVTTSNRFTAADHMHTHARDDDDDTSLERLSRCPAVGAPCQSMHL